MTKVHGKLHKLCIIHHIQLCTVLESTEFNIDNPYTIVVGSTAVTYIPQAKHSLLNIIILTELRMATILNGSFWWAHSYFPIMLITF